MLPYTVFSNGEPPALLLLSPFRWLVSFVFIDWVHDSPLGEGARACTRARMRAKAHELLYSLLIA